MHDGHVGGRPGRAGDLTRSRARGRGQQLPYAGGPVRRCELDAERGGEAALVGHHGGAGGGVDLGTGRGLGALAPGVRGIVRGDDPEPVLVRAHGDVSGDPVQRGPRGVGGQDHVDGFDPAVQRGVEILDRTGPEQRGQHVEAEVPGDAGRVAEADEGGVVPHVRRVRYIRRVRQIRRVGPTVGVRTAPYALRVPYTRRVPYIRRVRPARQIQRVRRVPRVRHLPDDHRPPVRLHDLHRLRLAARHLDGLRMGVGPVPAVRAQGLHPAVRRAAQLLAVEVLVVGHRVGDRPGHPARVAEVCDARDAWDGQAHHVELGAGEPQLLVDARVLDEAVRVTGDDRGAGGGAGAGEEPAVGAGGAGAVGGEEGRTVVPEPAGDLLTPELGGEPGEEDVGGEPDAERGPGLPAAGGEPGGGELRGAGGPFGQARVDPVDVRAHPGGGPGRQPLVAAAGGVGEPGPPGEPVPVDGLGAQVRGGRAEQPVALGLQLPGPVHSGVVALGAGERERAAGPQVGYPPVVPEDLEGSGPLGPLRLPDPPDPLEPPGHARTRSLAVDASGRHRSAHPLFPVVFGHSPAPRI